MEFLVDTQLPPGLTMFLAKAGQNAKHTIDYAEGALMKDQKIIEIASAENRIIITKDRDFLDYYILKGAPPKVLLIQLGNATNKNLIESLNKHLVSIVTGFSEGHNLISLQHNGARFYD